MRKLISLLLVIAMLSVSVFAVDFSQKTEALNSLGVPTDGTRDIDSAVTRQEFAQAVALLYGAKHCEPKPTVFSDVGVENVYSGYIDYLVNKKIISAGGQFLPEAKVDATFAYEIILNILGYERYATGADAVAFATSQLQLNQVTEFKDGFLTYGGMIGLLFGTLEANMPKYSYEVDNSGNNVEHMELGTGVYLTEMRNLSVYNGTVVEADRERYRVTLDVTKKVYETNKLNVAVGSEHTFDASTTIDISKYDRVPVVVWVDSNENIITMYPQQNYEVMYAPIYSVNDNNSTAAKYSINDIDRLKLWDDETEYEVLANATVKYNGKMTEDKINFAGKYAKLVVKEEKKVVFIETWDITEGGLTTEITENALTFQRGTTTAKLSPLNSYYNTIVIINDESRDFADLKTNTYFDYYKDLSTGTLVIFAKEDILTNELSSIGKDSINLGGISYKLAKKVYLAEEGTRYIVTSKQKLVSVSGKTVTAYLNAMRECVYIKLGTDEEASKSEFFGLLMGSRTQLFGNTQISVMNIEGTPEKKTYELSKRARYIMHDGTSVAATEAPVYTEGGNDGIYLFKLNAKGEISRITYPPSVYGFDNGAGKTVGNVNTNGTAAYMNTSDNRNLPFDANLPLYILYTDYFTGEVKVLSSKRANFTYFSGKSVTRAFGYENTPEVRLLVMTSTDNFDSFKNWNKKYGLIKRSGKSVVDEDGNVLDTFKMIAKDSETEINLSNEVSALIPDMAFIQYYTSHTFGANDIYVGLDAETVKKNIVLDLSDEFPTWTDDTDMKTNIIKSIHSNIIVFEGDIGYSTASSMFICETGRTGNDGFPSLKQISIDELNVGDTVYYCLSTNNDNQANAQQILLMFVYRP